MSKGQTGLSLLDYDRPLPWLDREIDALSDARGRGVRLHAGWTAKSDPKGLARRVLEIATARAIDVASARQLGDHIKGWAEAEVAARRANIALSAFIKNLAGGAIDRGADALIPPLSRMTAHTMPSDPSRFQWARQSALILIEAGNILEVMEPYMRDRRDALTDGRTVIGEPEKEVFLDTWADAWVYLTGKLPGSNEAADRNPFLRLVEAAWLEAGGQADRSFAQALRRCRVRMKSEPKPSPDIMPLWLR